MKSFVKFALISVGLVLILIGVIGVFVLTQAQDILTSGAEPSGAGGFGDGTQNWHNPMLQIWRNAEENRISRSGQFSQRMNASSDREARRFLRQKCRYLNSC